MKCTLKSRDGQNSRRLSSLASRPSSTVGERCLESESTYDPALIETDESEGLCVRRVTRKQVDSLTTERKFEAAGDLSYWAYK